MSQALRRYAAEACGTFALVAIGPGAVMVAAKTHAFGHMGIALAFGLAVTLIVASSGHLGGAHVNPAVTIGFWSVRRFPGREVVPYILAQCLGATAAAALLSWVLGPVGDFGATVPSLPLAQSFVVELGYTGLLGFVIMGVATDERTPTAVAPFAIGITIFAGALVTGPLTGGSFNPARTLGPAICTGRPLSSGPCSACIYTMRSAPQMLRGRLQPGAKVRSVVPVECAIGLINSVRQHPL